MKLFAAYKNGVRAMAEKANLIFRDKGRARRSMKKYGDDYIIKEVVIVEKETYNLLVERLEEANELIRNAREAGYEFPDPDIKDNENS